jgi:hypothetical protein
MGPVSRTCQREEPLVTDMPETDLLRIRAVKWPRYISVTSWPQVVDELTRYRLKPSVPISPDTPNFSSIWSTPVA